MIKLKRTIDDSKYLEIKDKINNSSPLISSVSLADMEFLDGSLLDIGGKQVFLHDHLLRKLMNELAIPNSQQRKLKNLYGDNGFKELGNILIKANANSKNRDLLFTFNKEEKALTDIISIKNSILPLSSGFNLVEILKNSFNLEISDLLYDNNTYGFYVNLYFPDENKILELGEGEEHILGVTVKMSPDELSVTNYLNRLVCENGATIKMVNDIHSITDYKSEDVKSTIEFVNNSNTNIRNMMKKKHEISVHTTASIAEAEHAFNNIRRLDIPEEVIMRFIPMHKYKHDYARLNINLEEMSFQNKRNMESDMSVWKLYNKLTEFGTHNADYLHKNSPSRNHIINNAGILLSKNEYDLTKNYPSPY